MISLNRIIGNKGESISTNFLTQKKYKILETNFKNKFGEIDIIAFYKGTIIFIEVKSRNNLNYGMPCESVTKKKQQKIKSVANYYIYIKNLFNYNVQFDIIEVIFYPVDLYKINHIKDAFT